MQLQPINIGSAANDGTGDSPRAAGQKINANFQEVAAAIAQQNNGIEQKFAQQDGAIASFLESADVAVDAMLAAAGDQVDDLLQALSTGQFPAGTLAGPSISFSMDPDTGFYRRAADVGAAVAGGVEAFRWTSAGIGIGNDPTSRLHVFGTANGETARFSYVSGSAAVRIIGNGASPQQLLFGTTTSQPGSIQYYNPTGILEFAAPNARARLDNTAFTVGMSGAGAAAAVLTLDGGSGANGGGYARFAKNGSTYGYIGHESAVRGGGSLSHDLILYAISGVGLRFYAGGAERMRAHMSGGISIGNAADPGAGNLMVGGTVRPGSFTVATLPSASAVGAGAQAYVTDASATTYRSVVAGGGANKITVVSDGVSSWLIGA